MANKIIIDVAKVIQQLHTKASALASRRVPKAKGVKILNSAVDLNTNNLDISINPNGDELNISECNKLMEEYLKIMFGEEAAKQLKPSDFIKSKSGNIDIKIDTLNNNESPIDNDDEKNSIANPEDSESNKDQNEQSKDNKKKKKKKNSLWQEFKEQIKDGMNVLRSIQIKPQYGKDPIKIGKILFGTTHDTEDTKTKLREAFTKEFPNNSIEFRIVNSETLEYLLFEKELNKDVKGKHWLYDKEDRTIRQYIKQSKFSLDIKVRDSDPNFEQIDEESIIDFLNDAIGFKPDRKGVKHIEGFIEEGIGSNADKSSLSGAERIIYDLKNDFNKDWYKINKKYDNSDVKKDKFKELESNYNKKFKDIFISSGQLDKEPNEKDKEKYDKWNKEFEKLKQDNEIDLLFKTQAGAKAPKGNVNFFIVPLMTNKIFKGLRHRFEDLGGKSTSDKDYGIWIP